MPDHKGHLLRRDILGRDDEVAFVLAVRRVEDDDEFAVLEGAEGVLDAVELELRGSIGWHLRGYGGTGRVACLGGRIARVGAKGRRCASGSVCSSLTS